MVSRKLLSINITLNNTHQEIGTWLKTPVIEKSVSGRLTGPEPVNVGSIPAFSTIIRTCAYFYITKFGFLHESARSKYALVV